MVRLWGLRNLPIIELPSFSSDATVASREHLSSDISDTSRPLAGDTRVTPEDKQRLAEQRAAEIAKRRADFNATNN